MSIVGNDEAGRKLRQLFDEKGINADLVFTVEDRPTTEKIRLLAKSNNQQVLRLDVENTDPFEKYYDALNAFESKIASFNLIIVSDYLKGFLSTTFIQSIIITARKSNVPVLVDVKGKNPEKYKHATLIKPNLKELSALTGLKVDTEKEIIQAARTLQDECCCRYVLTTCGSRGMILIGDDNPYFVKSAGKEVFDVTGAGDTAIAYLATGMANGLHIREAVDIANIAAGIKVSKVGTSSVCWNEIQKVIDNVEKNGE